MKKIEQPKIEFPNRDTTKNNSIENDKTPMGQLELFPETRPHPFRLSPQQIEINKRGIAMARLALAQSNPAQTSTPKTSSG